MSKLLLLLLLQPLLLLLVFASSSSCEPSKQADVADFPYHVSVRRDGRHVCSGALVHESWTITPASCVYEFAVPRISVLAGTTDLFRWSNGAKLLNVSKIVVHQSFDRVLLINDIALLKTGRVTQAHLPIFLPSSDKYHLKDGSVLRLVGWRGTRLSVASAPLVNQRSCALAMPRHRALSAAKMLCATSDNSCQVDAGAALVKDDVLVGLLSSADASCKYPGVYTRLSGFLPWINKALALDDDVVI